jgi:hypothetical protein
MLAVEILMQTIVIASAVLQQERGRPDLSGGVAAGDKIDVPVWIAKVNTHCRIPPVSYGREVRIQYGAQLGNDPGQRISKILVLAAPKSVLCHYYATAKTILFGIQFREQLAFILRDKALKRRAALRIKMF